jgi:hypothetical protein
MKQNLEIIKEFVEFYDQNPGKRYSYPNPIWMFMEVPQPFGNTLKRDYDNLIKPEFRGYTYRLWERMVKFHNSDSYFDESGLTEKGWLGYKWLYQYGERYKLPYFMKDRDS